MFWGGLRKMLPLSSPNSIDRIKVYKYITILLCIVYI